MNAGDSGIQVRFERLFRGVLGLALIAGVVWALAHGGSAPDGLGGFFR